MVYNKRRYRRVSVPFPIERLHWSGARVTMFQDGTWWVNSVGLIDGPNRPLHIALDGVRIDPFKDATPFQKEHGIVTMRSWPSLAPTHYGDKCGRKPRKWTLEDRFKRVEGGLHVPA